VLVFKNFFLLLFCCFSVCATDIVSISCKESTEFDCSKDKIIVADCENVYIVDSSNGKRKFVYKFKERQKIAPKLLFDGNFVFVNTEDAVFMCIDLDGNVVFEEKLPDVSRSEIFENNGNLFFYLINNYVVCYSKKGKLLWFNTKLHSDSLYVCGVLKFIENYLLFCNKDGLHVLDKRTGFFYKTLKEFSCSRDIYIENGIVFSASDNDSFSFNPKTGVCKAEKDYFPKFFLSKGVEYSYEKGVLKCVNNGKEYKFDANNFVVIDGLVFAYNKNSYLNDNICIINGESVEFKDFGLKVRKLFYKNGLLIVSDGSHIKWTRL